MYLYNVLCIRKIKVDKSLKPSLKEGQVVQDLSISRKYSLKQTRSWLVTMSLFHLDKRNLF